MISVSRLEGQLEIHMEAIRILATAVLMDGLRTTEDKRVRNGHLRR